MNTVLRNLEPILSPGALLTSPADIAAYSYDAALDRAKPDAILLARTTQDVIHGVRYCLKHKIPYTARGAGTNLCGGSIALRGGLVISLSPLKQILSIDTAQGFAVVEPGAINMDLQKELEKLGYFYAPDPASFKVSTLGGNIAENSGGPRCLKYGVTTNHVLALEAVMPDGNLEKFSIEDRGPEMMSLLVGSEGTLGLVTKAWLRITPLPQDIRTLLAGFSSINSALACVSEIIARGIIPRVLEAMDRMTVEAVEEYIHAGYPKTASVLLIELDGPPEEVAEETAQVEELCRRHGASDLRAAKDIPERERLWEGRRGAYAAMARLAPNVMVEDGVVPRQYLPRIASRIGQISAKYKVNTALLFHAGDGNIHPNIAYDERNADETRRVKAAGQEILEACVEMEGSLSGEHGIGCDKRAAMAWLFTPPTLALFRRIKKSLDPDNLANPDKIIPLPDEEKAAKLKRPAGRALSSQARKLRDKIRQCAASGKKMAICGRGSRWKAPPKGIELLETTGLEQIIDLDKENQTLTVETGISPEALHAELAKQGFFIRLPKTEGTLGGLLATKAGAGLRQDLLGLRLLLADGDIADLGGKVVKNVAGYDVPRLILGSWGTLGLILEVTLKIYSRPQEITAAATQIGLFKPTMWHQRLKQAFDPHNLLNTWLFEF